MSFRVSLVVVAASVFAGCAAGGRYTLHPATFSGDQQALAQQLDVGLRDKLASCGGTENGVITLKPRLETTADGMALYVLGVRSADQQVLGNFSLKASGSSREKQAKGIASRICQEASLLRP